MNSSGYRPRGAKRREMYLALFCTESKGDSSFSSYQLTELNKTEIVRLTRRATRELTSTSKNETRKGLCRKSKIRDCFRLVALFKQFQPHTDTINSIQLFSRSERLLVLTASSDCAVALWDIEGRHIGIFGQVI